MMKLLDEPPNFRGERHEVILKRLFPGSFDADFVGARKMWFLFPSARLDLVVAVQNVQKCREVMVIFYVLDLESNYPRDTILRFDNGYSMLMSKTVLPSSECLSANFLTGS
jgi:hypothetical protein